MRSPRTPPPPGNQGREGNEGGGDRHRECVRREAQTSTIGSVISLAHSYPVAASQGCKDAGAKRSRQENETGKGENPVPARVGVSPLFGAYLEGSRLGQEMQRHEQLNALHGDCQRPQFGRLVPEPPERLRACVCVCLFVRVSFAASPPPPSPPPLPLFACFFLPSSLIRVVIVRRHTVTFFHTPERVERDAAGTRSGDVAVEDVERRASVHYRVRQR